MTRLSNNKGIASYGGSVQVHNSAVGDGNTVTTAPSVSPGAGAAEEPGSQWGIGVVTVLPVETRSVRDVLGLDRAPEKTGSLWFYTGAVNRPAGPVKVVLTRAMGQGQRSAMAALENLRRHYNPAIMALVGIGGGFHVDAALADVVVSTRVVYYDLRKETPDGENRRGEDRESPAGMVHAVNAFFTDHGEPAILADAGGDRPEFRVLTGPIGSGEAVIANKESAITEWLTRYNDKTLAVDMEAGALSQFSQENSAGSGKAPAWVVVRGISDRADQDKNDDHHGAAARNAAITIRELIPYIT